jgi:hypothetical protein
MAQYTGCGASSMMYRKSNGTGIQKHPKFDFTVREENHTIRISEK